MNGITVYWRNGVRDEYTGDQQNAERWYKTVLSATYGADKILEHPICSRFFHHHQRAEADKWTPTTVPVTADPPDPVVYRADVSFGGPYILRVGRVATGPDGKRVVLETNRYATAANLYHIGTYGPAWKTTVAAALADAKARLESAVAAEWKKFAIFERDVPR